MTRQNVTEGVRETLTSICPTCGGEGRVLSQDTMAVEAERKLRKLARTSSAEAFRIRLNAKVAAKLVGAGGTRLIELERETGRFFTLDTEMRLPLEQVDVIDEGTRAEMDGDGLPVKEGEEATLVISEPHMFNLSDGVARLNGYQVVVGGAIGYVGEEHRVRIDRAMRSVAFATLLDAKPAAIELPPEPGDFELPDVDREIGERLELEERTRGRRRRTGTTTLKSKSPTADKEAASAPEVVEAGAEEVEAKPKRRRSRGGRSRTKAAATETATEQEAEDEAAAEAEAVTETDGDEAAKPKRRRGTRGGRGRTKKTTDTDGAEAGEEALLEPPTVVPAGDGEEPAPAAEKPKPARKPRARKPRATAAAAASTDGDAAASQPDSAPGDSAPPPVEVPPPAPEAPPGDSAAARRKSGILGRLLGE
jgi:predicted RNA-binding protein with TRAM domain